MKIGTELESLAKEVARRVDSKKDYVSSVNNLQMSAERAEPDLLIGSKVRAPLNKIAHEQLAEYLQIPAAYYNRMLAEQPYLLAENVNVWLPEKKVKVKSVGPGERPEQRLVRTLDGRVRAFLSDGYRRLENEDFLEAVLPALEERNLQLLSCELTERRLYLKAVDRSVVREIERYGNNHRLHNDIVRPIIVISNSEVGYGAVSVEFGVFTDWCTNLAIFAAKMKKYHTGSRAEVSDEAYELFSNETKKLTDAAVWSQARDLVTAGLNEAQFDKQVEALRAATEEKIEDDPVRVVERVAKRYSFTEGARTGIFKRLVEGGDLSKYGLHAAITRHSADEEDYDEATRMERIGGQIIELPKSDWKTIAEEVATGTRRRKAA